MLTSPKITGRPFERFTIDYIGPINPPSNGFLYILVGTCATTKYAIEKAYKHADSKSTVAFLIDVILQFGTILYKYISKRLIKSTEYTKY